MPEPTPRTTPLFRRRLATLVGALSHLEEARTEKKRTEYATIALTMLTDMLAAALKKSKAKGRR